MKILPVSGALVVSASVLLLFGMTAEAASIQQSGRDAGGLVLLAQLAPVPQTDAQPQSGDQPLGLAPAPAAPPPTGTAPAPATQQPATAAAPPTVVLTPNGTRQPPNTTATNGNVQPRGKLKLGQTGATFGSTQPNGLLPTYGNTSTLNGSPQTDGTQLSTGTQRNPTNALLGDSTTYGEQQVYGGTQSTLGTPRTTGTPISGGTQSYGGTQQSGSTLQGGGTIYTRQPLGASPTTRDLTGPYGSANGFDARGVYTGTATQPLSYGQPYATTRGVSNNLLGNDFDARSVTRPFIPLGNGPIRPNSGYGVPNGSKSTYMDARGIQRSN